MYSLGFLKCFFIPSSNSLTRALIMLLNITVLYPIMIWNIVVKIHNLWWHGKRICMHYYPRALHIVLLFSACLNKWAQECSYSNGDNTYSCWKIRFFSASVRSVLSTPHTSVCFATTTGHGKHAVIDNQRSQPNLQVSKKGLVLRAVSAVNQSRTQSKHVHGLCLGQ